MRKLIKRVMLCMIIAALIWCGTLIADRKQLHDCLIRLHVVGASNSKEDQDVKLQVRDAVIESLSSAMNDITDIDQAKAYLQENLTKIEKIANETLKKAGFDDLVKVSLTEEAFDTRVYDTFTLPAGVYEALRIVIGEGEGKNWWCVVFPTLCMPATTEGFEDVSVGAGFSGTMTNTLTGKEGYEVRFFLLDALGKLENIFFKG